MCVAAAAKHLGPRAEKETPIGRFGDVLRIDRLPIAGPPGAGIEFVTNITSRTTMTTVAVTLFEIAWTQLPIE